MNTQHFALTHSATITDILHLCSLFITGLITNYPYNVNKSVASSRFVFFSPQSAKGEKKKSQQAKTDNRKKKKNPTRKEVEEADEREDIACGYLITGISQLGKPCEEREK